MEELKVSLLAFAVDPVQQEKWRLLLSAGDPSDGVVLCIRERMDAGISSGIPPLFMKTRTPAAGC